MGEAGIWIPLAKLADRGFVNGEGGMMTRGDSGLALRLPSDSVLDTDRTDSVEPETTDVVDDSELVELVRVSDGCDVGGLTSTGFSSISSLTSLGALSLKWNLELVPVTGLASPVPVDMDLRKSR